VAKRPKPIHQLTEREFEDRVPIGDEDAPEAYLKARRWPQRAVHTSTIEGFRSLLKRGVAGTLHTVNAKCVADFQLRYNNRMNSDILSTMIGEC
jgi:hypothetical protein